MERLKSLLGKREFQLLLFHVCLVLFGWPVVTYHDIHRLETMFIYLFFAWGAIIFIMFLVSRSVDNPPPPEEIESGRR